MARKSAQRRLQELLALREQFKKNPAAAQFHNWTVGFIDSMIIKLEKGKGLTKKMRDKIDSIVDEGVPAIPDSREADEVEKWGKFLDSQGESILLDFANRMRKGWNLSEKQIAFRDRLVEQAKHNQNNGFWEPSPETFKLMDIACKLYYCYSSSYWYSHPGFDSNMKKLKGFLAGTERGYTEKDWAKAQYAVRGKLKLFEEPKFKCGDSCFIYKYERNPETNRSERVKYYGIVTSDLTINKNVVGYDVLVSGECKTYPHDNLKKR